MSLTDSPFGSVRPDNLPPPTSSVGKGVGKVVVKNGKRSKGREHYPRVIALCESEHGGFFYPCDGKKVGYGGAFISTDLLGFMDIQGVAEGCLIGVNVTSREGVAAHLRDYTNPAKTHGQAKIPVESLLRRFLSNGGRFLMYGYFKEGNRWRYDITPVTEDLLDEYKARKRGAK